MSISFTMFNLVTILDGDPTMKMWGGKEAALSVKLHEGTESYALNFEICQL